MLLGNGVRLGLSSDHALSFRTGIVVTVGADVVRVGSATYQHFDWTLREPGWGVMPRLAVGFVVRPRRPR